MQLEITAAGVLKKTYMYCPFQKQDGKAGKMKKMYHGSHRMTSTCIRSSKFKQKTTNTSKNNDRQAGKKVMKIR